MGQSRFLRVPSEALQKLARKAFGGGAERYIGERTQIHRARRNGKVGFQLADRSCGKLFADKFPRHRGDAHADARKVNEQAVRAGFQLRLDGGAVSEEEFFQMYARGRLAVKQDQRKRSELRRGVDMVKIAGIAGGSDKARVRFETGNVAERLTLLRRAGKGDVDLTGAEQTERLAASTADDLQMNVRVAAVEGLQMRQQKVPRDRVACADDKAAHLQCARLGKLVFARFQKP